MLAAGGQWMLIACHVAFCKTMPTFCVSVERCQPQNECSLRKYFHKVACEVVLSFLKKYSTDFGRCINYRCPILQINVQ